MYRNLYCNCLLFTGLAGATLLSTANAQDHLIDGAREEAARVIQLRPSIETAVQEKVEDFSSRTKRLATNPLANVDSPFVPPAVKVSKAPQVAFDEIGPQSSSVSSFSAPVIIDVEESAPPAPDVIVEQVQPPAVRVASSQPVRGGGMLSSPLQRNESTPIVAAQISAPEFVNVNEVAPVRIDVRNPGKSTVYDLKLVAMLPENVKVEARNGTVTNDQCIFEIDSLKPGENRQLMMEVVAETKQSLDIRTALTISNRSRIQVGVRQPKLVVSIEGPPQTNIGSKATHIVTVTNVGDGVAKNINLIADIPDTLQIVQKSGFESPETLRPGEKAQARIVTVPLKPGQTELAFAAEGNFCKAKTAEAGLRITQPELRVAAIGPDMNFVERDGIYTITVDNPGEVDINNVEVQFAIPEGVEVTTISRKAKMDGRQRTLSWKFDRIEAQTEQTIQLKAVAKSEGEKNCRIRVASDETNEKEVTLKTIIATRANLSIQMQNIGGPVQVGSETTFVVEVENRGSLVANDMEIEVQLPAGMRPANPKDGVVDENANSILFADSDLRPGKTRKFKFSAIGVEKGEHVVRSSLATVGSKQRIIVENSVYVYEPAQARVSESLQPSMQQR
jgi:hypothetical protein